MAHLSALGMRLNLIRIWKEYEANAEKERRAYISLAEKFESLAKHERAAAISRLSSAASSSPERQTSEQERDLRQRSCSADGA